MAITSPIAGAYTGVHNSIPLLYTRQGYNLHFTHKAERIEETDLYGLSLIELIYRGAQLTIDTICKVYGANSVGALSPWMLGLALGNVYTAGLPISQLGSAAARPLVLTAVPFTPAAVAAAPATLTVAKSIISPDQDFTLIFNSVLREVPLRWDALLVDTVGTGSVFVVT